MTHKAVCLSPWLGLAWRLSFYHHGSHTGIHTLAFNEVPMGIGMVHTLAFTYWHGDWHGGCLFIAMAHTLAWRLPVYCWHGGCLFIAMAHTLALGWHGGCVFIAGMEAVCLSPWLTHWHSHTAMGWHGGCLFIAITHCTGLAWRLSVYCHGSHTGIHKMATKEIHLPWH